MKSFHVKNKLSAKRDCGLKEVKLVLPMTDMSNLVETNDQLNQGADQISIKLKIDTCYLKTQTQIFK